jgi:hypothetical protein
VNLPGPNSSLRYFISLLGLIYLIKTTCCSQDPSILKMRGDAADAGLSWGSEALANKGRLKLVALR